MRNIKESQSNHMRTALSSKSTKPFLLTNTKDIHKMMIWSSIVKVCRPKLKFGT